MRRTFGIAAAWAGATLVAIAIAAAAVASVRTEVTDAPTALGTTSVVIGAAAPMTDPVQQTTSTTSMPAEMTTSTVHVADVPETSTTTTRVDTSASSPDTTKSPPVTAISSATSTTTASHTKTYDTEAGSVRIVVSGSAVKFGGATPLPGWTVELENSGPEEVKVHFERNDDEEEEIEFKATIDDGELKVSISEHGTEDEPKEESEDD